MSKEKSQKPSKEFLYLFNEGRLYRAYTGFGAHPEKGGVRFTVWAPDVKSVAAVGDWNGWNKDRDFLEPCGSTGVWSGFIAEAKPGDKYKYSIETAKGKRILKSDPFAFTCEKRPATASVVADLAFEWTDEKWLERRNTENHFEKPMNIYEVHAGSWKRYAKCPRGDEDDFFSYRRLADELIPYVKRMGYTHIELLPVMEHPLDASWGYQLTGLFAATSRYGSPQDLMYLINRAHRAGIGVILDWVPGHFCRDEHGLAEFNGKKLFESEEHPNWGTYKFDFSKSEVRSFLFSSAVFWLSVYHADGIRVDGVSSMLYRNFGYSEEELKRLGRKGDEKDEAAVSFLRELARVIGENCPGVFTVAEESSAWPLVTYPPEDGGLGFHYKWDMGWMNDTLEYFHTDFKDRRGIHEKLSFSMMYNFSENFVLALSHDEVVHGKLSLIGRMPGDYLQQFAGLRLLALYQMTHPGAKLNFMGSEFAQYIEWREFEGLDWFLADKFDTHKKHQNYVRALNRYYLSDKALYSDDHSWDGFKWIDADNRNQSVFIYERVSKSRRAKDIVILNLQPNYYGSYRIGVPEAGCYKQSFSTECAEYGGSGKLMAKAVTAEAVPYHGQPYSIEITLPALSGMILRKEQHKKEKRK